jgi:hypothetical protein
MSIVYAFPMGCIETRLIENAYTMNEVQVGNIPNNFEND